MFRSIKFNSDLLKREKLTDWWSVSLIAGIAVLIVFFDLGRYRTLTFHEAFVAVPVTEMLESNDWTVPRFGEIPRLRKPPLGYWVAALSSAVLGSVSEFSVRLPAALAGLGLVALIGFWAARWYGRGAGLAAATVQMLSVYAMTFSRKAEVDMLLCLLTTAAFFLIADQSAGEAKRSRTMRWFGIYVLLSLAWMAKFHYGPSLVIATFVMYCVVQKQVKNLFQLFNVPGLLLFAAAVLIWPLLVLNKIPNAWEIWREQTVGRALGELRSDPIWYYIIPLFTLTLPWSPLAISAVPASWRRAWRFDDSKERFLWVWFLTVLAVVSLQANKHSHYLLAGLPMVSLLAGRKLAEIFQAHPEKPLLENKRLIAMMMVFCGVIAFAANSIAANKWPHLEQAVFTVSVIFGFGSILCLPLLAIRSRWITAVSFAVFFLSFYVPVVHSIMPGTDHRTAAAQFATELRQQLPNDTPVCVYGMGKHPVIFYLNRPAFRVETSQELVDRVQQNQELFVLTFETMAEDLLGKVDGSLRVSSMKPDAGLARPKHSDMVLLRLTPKSVAHIQPSLGPLDTFADRHNSGSMIR